MVTACPGGEKGNNCKSFFQAMAGTHLLFWQPTYQIFFWFPYIFQTSYPIILYDCVLMKDFRRKTVEIGLEESNTVLYA